MKKQWYVVYTRPGCEGKVADGLNRMRFPCFCPMNRLEAAGRKSRRTVSEPLFPCYVFVEATDQQLPRIRQCRDVVSLVFWHALPVVVKREEIRVLTDLVNNCANIYRQQAPILLNELVRITTTVTEEDQLQAGGLSTTSIRVNLPSLGCILSASATGPAARSGRLMNLFTDNQAHHEKIK